MSSKRQLDIGILILNIIHCTNYSKLMQADEAYINKFKNLKKEKPNNMNYFTKLCKVINRKFKKILN